MQKFIFLMSVCLCLAACTGGRNDYGAARPHRLGDERVFSGSLAHRGYIILPEQVQLRVSLYKDGQAAPFASSGGTCPGQAELPFRVTFSAGDVSTDTPVTLRAEVLVAGMPFLETAGAVPVNLAGHPRIPVQRVKALPDTSPDLQGTYWRLLRLDGQPARIYPGQSVPHLILREDGQATGSDGCNNYFAQWKQSGQELTILLGGSTLMACPEGMDQARAVMRALDLADSWKIEGARLLLSGGGNVLAEFEAVTLHQ